MRAIAIFSTAAVTAALLAASCGQDETDSSTTGGTTTSAGGSGGTTTSAGGSGGSGGSGGADDTFAFLYDPNDAGGQLSCNGAVVAKPPGQPATCKFDDSGKLTVAREGWKDGFAVLSKESHIVGNCRGSLVPSAPRTYDALPDCVLVDEWFTDLPWHQKLSTVHSNLIDVPFVLPFDALRFDDLGDGKNCKSAATPTAKARCMLRYGIVNVTAMHRTDRLYAPGEAPAGQDCNGSDCVETKFAIQRFHTLTDKAPGYEADVVRNNPAAGAQSIGFAINVR